MIEHVAEREGDNWKLRDHVTDDELRALIADAKAEADAVDIEAEPDVVDPSEEFKRIVDEALGVPEAGAPAEGEAADGAGGAGGRGAEGGRGAGGWGSPHGKVSRAASLEGEGSVVRTLWQIAMFAAFAWPAAAAIANPNIVYILCDDLGYGDVHALNAARGKIATPHIDRLVSQGMTFTDAHSGSSVCTPTRYGILTGRYAWALRCRRAC